MAFPFLRLCICVYSYICMCPCRSQSLSPWSPLASWPSDSTAVLTLTSTYAAGKGQIVAKEEMREGRNWGKEVSFRGGGWGREQSCREHKGVALRQDKEWNRRKVKQEIVVEGDREREGDWRRAMLEHSCRGHGFLSLSLSCLQLVKPSGLPMLITKATSSREMFKKDYSRQKYDADVMLLWEWNLCYWEKKNKKDLVEHFKIKKKNRTGRIGYNQLT